MDDKELGRKVFASQVKFKLGPPRSCPVFPDMEHGRVRNMTVRYKGRQYTAVVRLPHVDWKIEDNLGLVMRSVALSAMKIEEQIKSDYFSNESVRQDMLKNLGGFRRLFGQDVDMLIELFGEG
jgi:hypothetical protein